MAVLALVLGLPLLAPGRSAASGLIRRREANAGSLQANHPRQDRVLSQLILAGSSRPAARPTADGAWVLLLLVLTLNSAVMIVRVAGSPPNWMRD